jgi:HD-like signal output (HDOD) protein
MTPAHNLLSGVAEKIPLPAVYHSIRGLIVRPDAAIEDFVEVINLDPALAWRIIRIANSQFFGYSKKAHTVKEAIALIGTIQLHDLLLCSLAIRAFSGIPLDIINQEEFWRCSIYCGISARLLAKKCMLPTRERLFTAGLLHEIGHLVMYAQIPEQMQDIFFELQESYKPQHQLEREVIGFDYGEVGSEIMQLWHLPENYCDITRNHMEPPTTSNIKLELEVINLARSIMLAEEGSNKLAGYAILNKADALISKKLTAEDVESIKNNARSFVDEVIDCLCPLFINLEKSVEHGCVGNLGEKDK